MTITIKDGKVSGTLITPGWEAAPLGSALPIDLTNDGNSVGWDAPLELGTSSVLAYGVYSSVLTALQLEPLVRAKHITRKEQVSAMWEAAGDAIKHNWLKFAAVTVVISILPGLAPVAGVASVFASVFMANKLCRAFWCALSPEQRDELSKAASNAGVNLPDEAKASHNTGSAAGYDNDEPLPTFA